MGPGMMNYNYPTAAPMVKIHCRTNIDGCRYDDWPTQLPEVPCVGQDMMSKQGHRLRIVAVMWTYMGTLDVELGQCT